MLILYLLYGLAFLWLSREVAVMTEKEAKKHLSSLCLSLALWGLLCFVERLFR